MSFILLFDSRLMISNSIKYFRNFAQLINSFYLFKSIDGNTATNTNKIIGSVITMFPALFRFLEEIFTPQWHCIDSAEGKRNKLSFVAFCLLFYLFVQFIVCLSILQMPSDCFGAFKYFVFPFFLSLFLLHNQMEWIFCLQLLQIDKQYKIEFSLFLTGKRSRRM